MILFMDVGNILDRAVARFDAGPWSAHTGIGARGRVGGNKRKPTSLYTADERRRRDETPWTLVQGILAPLQFLVFIVSLGLVANFLMTGTGYEMATLSIIIKTLVLYTIMVTGAIWEKVVFGQYLFAPAFFWEDAVSMVVIALHTAYLFAIATGTLTAEQQMMLALAAYAIYAVNAAQFLLKLRAARKQADSESAPASGLSPAE